MKILVLCDQGNNRSVVIAHHLKYWGHDVIPAGLTTNSRETIKMLYDWADRVILTEAEQGAAFAGGDYQHYGYKVQLWDVGPDTYPRPFNPELLQKVRRLMKEHEAEYKS